MSTSLTKTAGPKGHQFLGFHVSKEFVDMLDSEVEKQGLNRSIYIRQAIKEHLAKLDAAKVPKPSPTDLALATLDQLAAASRALRRDLATSFAAADAAMTAARQQLSAAGQLPAAATQAKP